MLSKYCGKTKDCFCVLHYSIITQNLNSQKKRQGFEGGWNTQNTYSGDTISVWHIHLYITTSPPVGNKLVLAFLASMNCKQRLG